MAKIAGYLVLVAFFATLTLIFAAKGLWWVMPTALLLGGLIVYAIGLALTGRWDCLKELF